MCLNWYVFVSTDLYWYALVCINLDSTPPKLDADGTRRLGTATLPPSLSPSLPNSNLPPSSLPP